MCGNDIVFHETVNWVSERYGLDNLHLNQDTDLRVKGKSKWQIADFCLNHLFCQTYTNKKTFIQHHVFNYNRRDIKYYLCYGLICHGVTIANVVL